MVHALAKALTTLPWKGSLCHLSAASLNHCLYYWHIHLPAQGLCSLHHSLLVSFCGSPSSGTPTKKHIRTGPGKQLPWLTLTHSWVHPNSRLFAPRSLWCILAFVTLFSSFRSPPEPSFIITTFSLWVHTNAFCDKTFFNSLLCVFTEQFCTQELTFISLHLLFLFMFLQKQLCAPTVPGRILCPYRNWGVLDDSDNSDPETTAPNNNNSIELFQHFSGISDENASARNNILIEMQKGKMQMYNHWLIFIFKSLSKVAERWIAGTWRSFKDSENTLYVSIMIDAYHYTFAQIQRIHNTGTEPWGILWTWMIMVYQYRLISCNKWTTLVGDANNAGVYACVEQTLYGKSLSFSSSFAVNWKLL